MDSKRHLIPVDDNSWIILQDIVSMTIDASTKPVIVKITTARDGATVETVVGFAGTKECAKEWCKAFAMNFNNGEPIKEDPKKETK